MKEPPPPRVAEWLARRAAPPADADFVASDLREEFDHRVALVGESVARRWYWTETLRSFFPLIARRWTATRPSDGMNRQGDAVIDSVFDGKFALGWSDEQDQIMYSERKQPDKP